MLEVVWQSYEPFFTSLLGCHLPAVGTGRILSMKMLLLLLCQQRCMWHCEESVKRESVPLQAYSQWSWSCNLLCTVPSLGKPKLPRSGHGDSETGRKKVRFRKVCLVCYLLSGCFVDLVYVYSSKMCFFSTSCYFRTGWVISTSYCYHEEKSDLSQLLTWL